jgi:tetratricopeptide (TPR) repeat protein
MGEYWFLTGQWQEGTRYIDAAIARSPDDRSIARAIALAFRPRVGGLWASVLHSEEQMREAIAIAESFGRADIVNEVTAFAGIAQMARGELDAGWSAVYGVAKSNDSTPWAAAQARMLLGMASAVVGNLDRARDECTISVNTMLALGDELNAATTLKNLGLMLQRHGNGPDARRSLQQAIEMSGGVMPGVDAQARCGLAEIDATEGAVDEVELQTLRLQFRRLGDFSGLTRANRVLARALLARGEVEPALNTLQDSMLYLVDHEEQALGLVLLDIAEIKRRRLLDAEADILIQAATLLAAGTGYGWSADDRARVGPIPRQRSTPNDAELSLIQRAVSLAMSA